MQQSTDMKQGEGSIQSLRLVMFGGGHGWTSSSRSRSRMKRTSFLALRVMKERQQRKLREMMMELSNVASLTLISLVPQYHNYLMNHIDREGPTWMPGGAGGGGEWKVIVGIKEGTSQASGVRRVRNWPLRWQGLDLCQMVFAG